MHIIYICIILYIYITFCSDTSISAVSLYEQVQTFLFRISYIYNFVYIHVCVCVCVCATYVCLRDLPFMLEKYLFVFLSSALSSHFLISVQENLVPV